MNRKEKARKRMISAIAELIYVASRQVKEKSILRSKSWAEILIWTERVFNNRSFWTMDKLEYHFLLSFDG